MTTNLQANAMQRYHDYFDNAQYQVVADFVASNFNADRDDERVVQMLVALQNAAFELCGHSLYSGAWHVLAVQCGQNFLSFHAIDVMAISCAASLQMMFTSMTSRQLRKGCCAPTAV